MPDIADEAQGAEELLIEQGLIYIRSQFTSPGSEYCTLCGDIIPERRRQLLPGVCTCVECQERRELHQKIGLASVSDSEAS